RAFRFDTTTAWEERKGTAEWAIPVFEELGDEFGLYLAHRVLGAVHWTQGRSGASETELELVMEHARRAGAARAFPFLIHWLAGASRTGLAEEILGDLERAESVMRPAVETLFAMGEKSFVSTLAAQLARVLALRGKLDEAARFAELGREASPADDWASQISWRSALTQVLARRGDLDEAARLARQGVALTE